jgi:HAD superfamily hydrolase (TIGR01509 family)
MLIIFDCDGVLVDSESLAAQVFSIELQKYGIALDALECEKRFRGHTLQYCLGTLERHYPGRLPSDFTEILSSATQDAFGKQLLPMPGVESVLQWLRSEKYAFCVASNGALAKVHHSLEVTGLRPYFGSNCFSAESVRAGKPAPDLFLHAAETLGFDPHQAVVVEDSSAGVAAALNAGMRVCVFGSASIAGEGVIRRFDHMVKLPPILTAWIRS